MHECRATRTERGAGTSTNMNVKEVIANRSLEFMGKPCGDYAAPHRNDITGELVGTADSNETDLCHPNLLLRSKLVRRFGLFGKLKDVW